MSDDDLSGWALPAFKPDEALQTLRRGLRDLKLQEQAGTAPLRYQFKGKPVAELSLAEGGLQARWVKRPSHSPEWQSRTLGNAAAVRDWLAALKRQAAGWDGEE